jgi:hypothetical protein
MVLVVLIIRDSHYASHGTSSPPLRGPTRLPAFNSSQSRMGCPAQSPRRLANFQPVTIYTAGVDDGIVEQPATSLFCSNFYLRTRTFMRYILMPEQTAANIGRQFRPLLPAVDRRPPSQAGRSISRQPNATAACDACRKNKSKVLGLNIKSIRACMTYLTIDSALVNGQAVVDASGAAANVITPHCQERLPHKPSNEVTMTCETEQPLMRSLLDLLGLCQNKMPSISYGGSDPGQMLRQLSVKSRLGTSCFNLPSLPRLDFDMNFHIEQRSPKIIFPITHTWIR